MHTLGFEPNHLELDSKVIEPDRRPYHWDTLPLYESDGWQAEYIYVLLSPTPAIRTNHMELRRTGK